MGISLMPFSELRRRIRRWRPDAAAIDKARRRLDTAKRVSTDEFAICLAGIESPSLSDSFGRVAGRVRQAALSRPDARFIPIEMLANERARSATLVARAELEVGMRLAMHRLRCLEREQNNFGDLLHLVSYGKRIGSTERQIDQLQHAIGQTYHSAVLPLDAVIGLWDRQSLPPLFSCVRLQALAKGEGRSLADAWGRIHELKDYGALFNDRAPPPPGGRGHRARPERPSFIPASGYA